MFVPSVASRAVIKRCFEAVARRETRKWGIILDTISWGHLLLEGSQPMHVHPSERDNWGMKTLGY